MIIQSLDKDKYMFSKSLSSNTFIPLQYIPLDYKIWLCLLWYMTTMDYQNIARHGFCPMLVYEENIGIQE